MTLWLKIFPRLSDFLAALVIAVVLAIQWPLYATFALNSDEGWFVSMVAMPLMHAQSLLEKLAIIFSEQNHLGYGSFFWSLLAAMYNLFNENTIIVFHTAVLISYLGLTYALFRISERRSWLGLALMLMAPSFWWYAKIIAPDSLSIIVGLAGLVVLHKYPQQKRVWLGWGLLGFAIGLKTTALAFAIYSLMIIESRSIQHWAKAFGALLLGFVLSTPYILLSPKMFVHNMAKARHEPYGDIATYLRDLYFLEQKWNFDMVYEPATLNYVSSPLVLIFIAFLFFLYLPRRHFVSWLLTIVFSLILVMSTSLHCWYFFPLYFLTVFLIFQINVNLRNWLGFGIFASYAYILLPVISENVHVRKMEIQETSELEEVQKCLEGQYFDTLIAAQQVIAHPAAAWNTPMKRIDVTMSKVSSADWLFSISDRPPLGFPVVAFKSKRLDFLENQSPWNKMKSQRTDLEFQTLGQCRNIEIVSITEKIK